MQDDNNEDTANNKKRPAEDTAQYQTLIAYGEHKKAVSSVKVAPSSLTKHKRDSILVASASADGTCKLWDLQNNLFTEGSNSRMALHPFQTFVGHARGINAVCWNPVSPLLLTASDDKTVRVWDALTADALVELKGHDNFVFCLDSFNNCVVTGSFDETVKLWDIRSAECVSTLPAHSDPVTSVCFNRDGTTVCSSSHDGLIRLWDVATSECLKTIYAAGNPPVSAVQFSPNSKYILSNTLDSTLRLWPVTVSGQNKVSKTYQHAHYVNEKYSIVADFSCDGNIVVGSENGNVLQFDLNSKECQKQGRHDDAVLAVSCHDSRPFFCSGSLDRKVEFWVKKDDRASRQRTEQ